MKNPELESYGLPEDNFSGDNVCLSCHKLDTDGNCKSYDLSGMARWRKMGHCPLVSRWADWREDKPVEKGSKVRVGQQKQRKL